MVKVMDCGIVISEFVLQSHYYVHFRANTLGKGMSPLWDSNSSVIIDKCSFDVIHQSIRVSLCSVVVIVLDCDIVVREIELQSRYYIHFRTNTLWESHEPSYPFSYGSNTTTTVLLQEWRWYWITHAGWYVIKQRNQSFTSKSLNCNENYQTFRMIWKEFLWPNGWSAEL